VAFTLQQGRRELEHRRAVVVGDAADAVEVLRSATPERTWNGVHKPAQRRCVFLFPGQGSQYPGMGAELYENDSVFRSELDRCCELLEPILGIDLRDVIELGSSTNGRTRRSAPTDLGQTAMTQPALFAVEYALARMWMSWGIKPEVMIGHSIGEYVAACLAGVFSLEDALALVAERGRLIQELPGGDMLGVPLNEEELRPRLEDGELSLAAVNAPDRLVVSGPAEAVTRFAEALQADGIDGRRLHTSHAFHSAMLEPAVEPFARRVAEVERKAPAIPFFSCLTGVRITAEEAVDPAYWAAQLRRGVRFSAGVAEILQDPSRVLLEVGPGSTLTTLTRRHLEKGSERTVVASLPSPKEKRSAHEAALTALGRLWLAGLSPDWPAVHGDARRRRIPLPSYPFERQRYWVEESTARVGQGALTAGRRPQEWLFSPGWKTSRPPRGKPAEETRHELGWLLLSDGGELAEALAKRVQKRGWPVTVARRGDGFADCGHGIYTLRPEERDYDALLEEIRDTPPVVLYLWSMNAETIETESFDGLLRLARSLGHRRGSGRTALWVLTNGLHEALAQEGPSVARSSLLAACRAVNRGYPNLVCRHLDLFLGPDGGGLARLPEQILAEVTSEPSELTIACWRNRRWVPVMEAVAPVEGEAAEEEPETLPEGNYLVTGGLEEPGFSLAASLSTGAGRRLLLLEPDQLPPRQQWEELEPERAPSAEELNAFLATLAAENGIDVDMAARGAEIPERMEGLAGEVEREELPQGFDALSDALCAAYAHRFFAGQVDVAADKSYQRDELRRSMEVVPQFERFFNYLLHVLARAGMVELAGDTVTFRELPEGAVDAEGLGRLAAERFPAFRPGIECIAHCAAHYPEAFRGAVDPVSILYPDGSTEMLRQVMETQDRYSINRIFYPLMVEQIREAAAGLSHRPLRILEFGAGDGNLTWELAEALRGYNVEYHFTDIGRAFVVAGRKAAEERGLDFMRFGVLDVTRDPEEQGYERYSFDVLVTFDVVHATPRIRETMLNLKRLLAPGGWTMLLEPTRDQHWITLIWGLAEGWWLFADEELRTLHPLLDSRQWADVLGDLGFSHCEVFPLDLVARAAVDHSLLVVQQPADLRVAEYLEAAVARWQERRRRIAERTRRVQELESRGTEVVLLQADIENAGEVTAAVGPLRERWGPLAGVVHAAGPWNGTGQRDDELDPAAYPRTLNRSAAAIRALEAAVAADGCELALLVSPLAAAGDEVPGPENAADLYLSAYASRDRAAAVSWRSLAWGVPVTGASRGEGLSSHLGATALAGLVDCPELTRVLVTHRPPAAMAGAWNRLPDTRTAGASGAGGAGDGYVAPDTEQEKTVAGIWQEVLGIERVGLHDNFFELGGDSLIATQIHSRIRETFKIKMPVEKLFELPTLEAQARAVAEILAEKDQRQHEEIMAVLTELSDEEAEQALLELT
ncbi:MAG: acyltransferase domain-containing protein, partial [bacterium]|nr:acyltransferase domain-containing protein [bacterium]